MADAATTQSTPKGDDEQIRRALELAASGLPPEAAAAQQEQADEWGTWVATQPIFFGGVLAAGTGHALPNANVEKYKYDQLGWAAKRTTKAGREALAATGIEV